MTRFFAGSLYCQNIRRVSHMVLVVNTINDMVYIILTLVFCLSTVASAESLGRSAEVDAVCAITI